MNLSQDKQQKLIQLYSAMSELTQPECKNSCTIPYSCCSSEYCESTIGFAKEVWNVTLEPTNHPELPLMGESGCIATPHLRPMCTLHTCDINGIGFKRNDLNLKWTNKYFTIREEIQELEFERISSDDR